MDGRFVPEISFGPAVVRTIRRAAAKPLNLHLMVVEPERSIAAYAEAGADHLLVQAEPGSTIHLIDPGTPLVSIEYVLHLVEIVLIMTVNPGLGWWRREVGGGTNMLGQKVGVPAQTVT